MTGGILLFCERTGKWAAALRRELLDSDPPSRELRSLAECRQALGEHPRSLVLLEATAANLEAALEFLAAMNRDFPRARAVVAAQRGLEDFQWIARELGALAFTTSSRDLRPIARLIERYLASLPAPERTLEEEIWRRLPWSRAAARQQPPEALIQ